MEQALRFGMAIYKWDVPGNRAGNNSGCNKMQVAAYCRVSTTEQGSSYDEQCRHYADYIRRQPDWELFRIYADEGVSGTAMKHRKEFKQLLRDCEAGLIDIVITKSISRFARNTVDTLVTIRRLRDLNVRVIFEKEQLDSSDLTDEFMLTFWASFAQAESVSISQNVSKSLQTRMARGEGRVNTSRSIGYARDADGQLCIIPEEARIIQRIYREYLEGASTKAIAKGLELDGIPACVGGKTWHAASVNSIMENEKNMGDLLFQKTFTADTLTHRIKTNEGQLPKYYVSGHHEPIVPPEIFYRAQGERAYRASVYRSPQMYLYGREDALSNKVYCGICGRMLKVVIYPDESRAFRCCNRAYQRKTGWKENKVSCPCRKVTEKEARLEIRRAFRMLPDMLDDIRKIEAQPIPSDVQKIEAQPISSDVQKIEAQPIPSDVQKIEAQPIPPDIQKIDAEIRRLSELPVTEEVVKHRVELYARRANYSRMEAQIITLRHLAEQLEARRRKASLEQAYLAERLEARRRKACLEQEYLAERLEAREREEQGEQAYLVERLETQGLAELQEDSGKHPDCFWQETDNFSQAFLDMIDSRDGLPDNRTINRFIDRLIIEPERTIVRFKAGLVLYLS